MGRLDLDADQELGAETTRLLVSARGQLGTADTIGEPGIVLDPRACAGLPAGRVPLAYQRTKPLRRRIYSGGEARRPGTDDHRVVELIARRRRQTRARSQLGAPASRGQITLARDALRPAGHQLGVFLGALRAACRRETERAASGRRSRTRFRAEEPADPGRGQPSDEERRFAPKGPGRHRRQGCRADRRSWARRGPSAVTCRVALPASR